MVQEGHSFGELGFVNKTYRSGSVVATEDCFFGCLDQNGYESSVIEADKRRIKNHTHFLS